MSLHIDTRFEWERLQPLCDAVWSGRKTHNRERSFYEYLRRQPTLAVGEEPVAQLVADDGIVEGMLAFHKYHWGEGSVYSAVNWYTRPRGPAGMHGALLLQYWRRLGEVMVAGHPRSHLATTFSRANWWRLDTETFWWPTRLSGLRVFWPGRQRWREALRMMAQAWPGRSHADPVQVADVQPLVFAQDLEEWLKALGKQYQFFNRSAEYLAWQYTTWQPTGEHFRARGVYSAKEGMIGFFVLRLGKPLAVVCELLALPGHWARVVQCAQEAAAVHPATTAVRMRTNVPEAITAAREGRWIVGRAVPNFFRWSKAAAPDLTRFIFSTGDSDEYLL